MSAHERRVLLSMRPGHKAGAGCSCGWHSHSQTFQQHLDEVQPSSGHMDDFAPERILTEVDLTEAAAMVVALQQIGGGTAHGALAVWSALLGTPAVTTSDTEALAEANRLAAYDVHTRAAVIPF